MVRAINAAMSAANQYCELCKSRKQRVKQQEMLAKQQQKTIKKTINKKVNEQQTVDKTLTKLTPGEPIHQQRN